MAMGIDVSTEYERILNNKIYKFYILNISIQMSKNNLFYQNVKSENSENFNLGNTNFRENLTQCFFLRIQMTYFRRSNIVGCASI